MRPRRYRARRAFPNATIKETVDFLIAGPPR